MVCNAVYLNPPSKLKQWYNNYKEEHIGINTIRFNALIVDNFLVEFVSEVSMPPRTSKTIQDCALKLNDVHVRIFLNKIVWLIYRGCLIYFYQGGTSVPCPHFLAVVAPLYPVSLHCIWWSVVVVFFVLGIKVAEGGGGCSYPWRAYLIRLIPAPSSHWGICTLIRCSGTRDPCMQQWVARKKVITILLLTYPHVFKYGCFHLVARRLDNLFKVFVTSTPSSPSTEATKG